MRTDERLDRTGAGRTTPVFPAWAVPVGLCALAAIANLISASTAPRVALFAAPGLAGAVSALVGVRVHRPVRRTPWILFATAQALFAGCVVARPLMSQDALVVVGLVHLAGLVAYGAAVVGIVLLVRTASTDGADRAAHLDSAMVAIGLGTFVVLDLSLPALRAPGRPAWTALAEAAYPVYDLALLVALLLLGFTAALRLPAYRYLAAAMTLLILGDLGVTWLGQRGVTPHPVSVALPYLVASVLFVMSALHPTMREVGSPPAEAGRGAPDTAGREWTTRRMTLFVPALVLPAVLLVRPRGPVELAVIGTASSAALLVLLVRARSALRTVQHVRGHDDLTGLVTRDTFVTALGRWLAGEGGSAGPVEAAPRGGDPGLPWVLLVDLDGHRHVVQFWGHETGDRLVLEAAERLTAVLPPGTLTARLGGDVFAALVAGPRGAAVGAAERLRGAVAAAVDVDGLELTCTASIGVAPVRPDVDPLEVLRDADTAMTVARAAGGDRVAVFEPDMREGMERRAALEQALRYAAGSGELSVVYQPVVDLPTGAVIGAEALLRWTSPGFGVVPPLEFIQIAEETGMIDDLGSWVLSQACGRLAGWDATGLVKPEFTMAVNVSTRQLRDDALPDRLREVLRETGVAPNRVVLEVTESAMHDDQEAFIRVLRTLRDVGVQISIDDFGTGYSSLSYLSRLPATSVKLDRSLVQDVAVPPGDAIARAVQGIAQALGLTVVAEGVEDEAQRSALNDLNIAHAQGYLWGRPVPPKDFLAQLAPPPPPRMKRAVRPVRS